MKKGVGSLPVLIFFLIISTWYRLVDLINFAKNASLMLSWYPYTVLKSMRCFSLSWL